VPPAVGNQTQAVWAKVITFCYVTSWPKQKILNALISSI
jgi:hypothetical protein